MPIVQALQSMGVNAEMTGRNDIQVGQAKISGNAMVKVKIECLVMVLMLNCDLNEVQKALKVNPAKIKSKGVKSVRKRVANIEEFLEQPIDIEEFKKLFLKLFLVKMKLKNIITRRLEKY